jgi:aspartate kinase
MRIVQKYGGTSVGSVARMRAVAAQVAALRAEGHAVAVVVSAMGDSTDRLLDLARELTPEPPPRELDALLATGEMVSTALLATALASIGCPARSYNALQLPLATTALHGRARILSVEAAGRSRLISGQASCRWSRASRDVVPDGSLTTIGRGGSDTSAVALAIALQADECQILTDVDGVYTTDPRVVPDARRLDRISFEEMLELAGQGSRVLHLRCVEFAARYGVKLRVLSSFRPGRAP